MSRSVSGSPFELRNIHLSFQQGMRQLCVLEGASLMVAAGEVVALLGPSGSGKSSLLHIAGLLEKPDQGELLIDAMPVPFDNEAQRTRLRRAHIGFVYQFHNLLPEFTACENVALPARLNGASRKSALARADVLLGELDLADWGGHLPAQLSGGEQQRVAIARALINRPKIILADEPTGSLDNVTGGKVADILLQLARTHGSAVLLATHDVVLAGCADRIVILSEGQIIEG